MRSIYLILKNHFKGEKTMKNFRKLIPAVCMLLLAAVMAGTSTFAWFSMNTTVTAGTMAVSATAPTNLRICATNSDNDSAWSGALSLSASLTTMVPVSCDNTNSALAFYKVKANGDKIDYNNGAYKEDTTFEPATAGKDYYTTSFWIKAVGADASDLKLSTITRSAGGTKELDKALRVMAVCGENKFIYEPVTGAAATPYKAVQSLNTEKKPVLGNDITVSNANSVLADTVTKTPVQVTIYIWYEGQDPACKSANTVDMAGTTFSLSFTVTGK